MKLSTGCWLWHRSNGSGSIESTDCNAKSRSSLSSSNEWPSRRVQNSARGTTSSSDEAMVGLCAALGPADVIEAADGALVLGDHDQDEIGIHLSAGSRARLPISTHGGKPPEANPVAS